MALQTMTGETPKQTKQNLPNQYQHVLKPHSIFKFSWKHQIQEKRNLQQLLIQNWWDSSQTGVDAGGLGLGPRDSMVSWAWLVVIIPFILIVFGYIPMQSWESNLGLPAPKHIYIYSVLWTIFQPITPSKEFFWCRDGTEVNRYLPWISLTLAQYPELHMAPKPQPVRNPEHWWVWPNSLTQTKNLYWFIFILFIWKKRFGGHIQALMTYYFWLYTQELLLMVLGELHIAPGTKLGLATCKAKCINPCIISLILSTFLIFGATLSSA